VDPENIQKTQAGFLGKEKTATPWNRKHCACDIQIVAALWSCWADSNRRPHPYQLLKRFQSAAMQRFRGVFVPEG
jgi:hypothetical protein